MTTEPDPTDKLVMDGMIFLTDAVPDQDVKDYLEDHRWLVKSEVHEVLSSLVISIFGADNKAVLQKAGERLALLRRCIDVGIDLGVAGY